MLHTLLQITPITPIEQPTFIEEYGVWGNIAVLALYLTYQLISNVLQNKRVKYQNESSLKFQNVIYRQLESNAKVNQSMEKYLKVIADGHSEEVTEAQARIIVERIFESSKYAIKSYISKVMTENHIEGNENEIKEKITYYLSNRYDADILAMKECKYKGKKLSSKFQDIWKTSVIENMIAIVLNRKSERALQSSLSNSFDSFKTGLLNDIL